MKANQLRQQEITADEFRQVAWKSWFNANPAPTEFEIARAAWKLEKIVRHIKRGGRK